MGTFSLRSGGRIGGARAAATFSATSVSQAAVKWEHEIRLHRGGGGLTLLTAGLAQAQVALPHHVEQIVVGLAERCRGRAEKRVRRRADGLERRHRWGDDGGWCGRRRLGRGDRGRRRHRWRRRLRLHAAPRLLGTARGLGLGRRGLGDLALGGRGRPPAVKVIAVRADLDDVGHELGLEASLTTSSCEALRASSSGARGGGARPGGAAQAAFRTFVAKSLTTEATGGESSQAGPRPLRMPTW